MKKDKLILILLLIIIVTVLSYYWMTQPETPPETNDPEYTVIAENLKIPWSIAITQKGEIIFTERGGAIVILKNNSQTILKQVKVYHEDTEGGLLGVTLHPNFQYNQKIYTYNTYEDPNGVLWNKITQYTLTNQDLKDPKEILDKIPGGRIHDGGRIKFGPDDKLYATTGETGTGSLAQNKDSLAGKILRVNPDGSIPEDNPKEDSPIYSIGHRNPQGLAWHPETERLYAIEHGPSGESLRFAHDEINLIEPMGNYGWPDVIGDSDDSQYINPIFHTGDDTWAPSGATFLNKPDSIWHNRLFVANLRGNGIRMITFKEPDYIEVDSIKVIYEDLGRIRTVVQGPDNYLYFCTSNRDGRGNPDNVDDIIAKFKPP